MFKAYGLYSHIRANELRSAFLLSGFVVLLLALMFSFALIIEAMSAPPARLSITFSRSPSMI